MSYEMFVQRFEHGEPAAMPTDAFDSVFRPYIDQTRTELGFWHLHVEDGGEADLYAHPAGPTLDNLMINRFSPGLVLELLVEFAHRAQAVILPPGCPTMITYEAQRQHLPEELRAEAVVVSAGSDVEGVLQSC